MDQGILRFSDVETVQRMSRTSRLDLPNVTLIAVDTWHPAKTLAAMKGSMMWVTFNAAVLVCQPFKPDKGWWLRKDFGEVRPIFTADGPDRIKREEFIVRKLHKCFQTSHCLHMEWDSGVANPAAWDDSWLAYDYIGAPWPWNYSEPGVPSCTKDNCVGNLGFALISKRLLETVAAIARPTDKELMLSDVYICRTLRPQLEAAGLKFATESVAERFSCENRIYSGQFGWHGEFTAAKNGWKFPEITAHTP